MMNKISNTEYQELRNKIWEDLVASGVTSDEDENYQAFDNVLGQHLKVDWDQYLKDGSDICSGCETTQPYQTMKDVDETSFDIYCESCHSKAKAIQKLKQIQENMNVNQDVDWIENDPCDEFKLISEDIGEAIKDLDNSN